MSSENIATPAAAAAAPAPSLELEEWTLDVLAGCARDMGFSQWQLTHTPGSGAGDNFMGIVLRVNIAGTRNGTPDSRETVILKMPPQSAARRKQFNSAHLFEREILVYRDVLPLFVQFQLERGLKPQDANGFVAFPKCLACVCDAAQERYAIVLEDLKAQGCRMFDKSTIIDLAHVRLVMEAMGQLHGVSFALRDQRPLEFEPLAKLRDVFLNYVIKGLGHTMSDFIPAAFDRAIKTLRDDETALKAKLTHARDNYIAELEECVKLGAAGEYSVLNHGDCWNNNMMYQYGDHVSGGGALEGKRSKQFFIVPFFMQTSTVESTATHLPDRLATRPLRLAHHRYGVLSVHVHHERVARRAYGGHTVHLSRGAECDCHEVGQRCGTIVQLRNVPTRVAQVRQVRSAGGADDDASDHVRSR